MSESNLAETERISPHDVRAALDHFIDEYGRDYGNVRIAEGVVPSEGPSSVPIEDRTFYAVSRGLGNTRPLYSWSEVDPGYNQKDTRLSFCGDEVHFADKTIEIWPVSEEGPVDSSGVLPPERLEELWETTSKLEPRQLVAKQQHVRKSFLGKLAAGTREFRSRRS